MGPADCGCLGGRRGPRLHLIQGPAARLTPREEVSVVRYMVELGDRRRTASEGSSPGA